MSHAKEPKRESAPVNENDPVASAAAPDGADTATPDPFEVLKALQAENAEMKDRVLRTLAEMENLRRRTQREVADAKLYGVTNFARDMLTFSDNLTRALASVPQDVRDAAAPTLKSFVEGMELIERDFLARLARHGVKKIEARGAKFDPHLHEALFEVPDEALPHGSVAEVVEEGYTLGERTLRPAKVGTSRGGPKG
ncbi:MAG: nucleotide exchange factor GrpE [Hyphomicrobiales bacterium]|nr:nucleotide exchange factor GrpE [Hyphomicrobiales bacterium]